MSLKSGAIRPNANSFEKKPKAHSNKYANVAGVIDSGPTTAKVKPGMTAQELAKKRNEIFKRVSIAKLTEALKCREVHESIFSLADDAPCNDDASIAPSLCSKVTTATVVSMHTIDAQPIKSQDDVMVLDVREREMYDKCHLQHAMHYDKRRLVQDQITPELWQFKQAVNKKLVVYDVDDKLTGEIATLLVQKGWENIYALTGGLEEVAATYSEILDGDSEKLRSAPSPTRSTRSGVRPSSGGSCRTKASR